MAGDLDPAGMYPEDWVVFRLTGYRPEMERPALIAGADLIADLSPLIEHLCVAAELGEGDLGDPAGWLGAEEVCRRWGVSRKTLDRCRRGGLLARRVAVQKGSARHRIVFAAGAVEAFERRHAERLEKAAGFSRIDPETEERLARRAARYRLRLGWSLGQISARLAERTGRGRETIRQLILRNDAAAARAGATPLFARKGPLRSVQREVIERAYDRGCGVDASELARRHGVSVATVYRVLAERRAARLREWAARAAVGPAAPAGAGERALAHAAAREGLGRPGPATLAELLAFVESARPEGPAVEAARAAAFVYLRDDALRRVERLPRADPPVAELDEIETRLRWAARLKAEMVRSQLPLAVKTIESFLSGPGGRDLRSLPPRAAQRIAAVAVAAVIEGVERYDPAKGGRLAAPVGLALNRAVSAWARGEGAQFAGGGDGRASARPDPAAIALEDFTLRVSPWQAWLEPDVRVRAGLWRVPPELAEVLVMRMGWAEGESGGGPPRTLAEVARLRGVTPGRVSRLEHRAMRLALGLAAPAGGRSEGEAAGAGRG